VTTAHEWDADLALFQGHVAARLRQGHREYGGRTFAKPASDVIGELEQELFDAAAYAFIAWRSSRRAKDMAAMVELEAEGGAQPVARRRTRG